MGIFAGQGWIKRINSDILNSWMQARVGAEEFASPNNKRLLELA